MSDLPISFKSLTKTSKPVEVSEKAKKKKSSVTKNVASVKEKPAGKSEKTDPKISSEAAADSASDEDESESNGQMSLEW